MSGFFDAVYAAVRSIPRGRVMSYGQVAALAGRPRGARMVGWALRTCPEDVPWQRVVRRDGSLAIGELQRALLTAEGVQFDGEGRVLRSCFALREPDSSI